MEQHSFKSLEDFRGASLPYFTTHHELVGGVQRPGARGVARPPQYHLGSCAVHSHRAPRSAACCLTDRMPGRAPQASPAVQQGGRQDLRVRRPPHPLPLPPPPPQVRMQREALEAKKKARVGLAKDDEWSGDGFVAEAESMVSN